MHKTHAKRRRDIKNKLMAAICMLLVSSIMMVSTTYAWFTLSTAPEVTGINTAVGANGNLEIALMPKDGLTGSITSAAGDSLLAIEAKNVTWGNLVDLSDSSVYGLDSITLYPAALNGTYDETTGYLTTIGATMLKTPTYGSDGRVADLVANTSNGYYDSTEKDFYPNDYLGVRAIGTASGMTARQLAYRNARSAANTAASNAKTVASQSLNTNGSTLANIAIKYGTSGADAKFNMADLEAMQAIIDGLLGTTDKTGALQHIENAYKQYILAYAASAAVPVVKTTGAEGEVEAETQPWQAIDTTKSLAEVISAINSALPDGTTLPSQLTSAISNLDTTKSNVNTAQTTLSNLITAAKAEYAWSDISPVLTALANPENMEVNGIKASEIKQDDNMSKLVNSVASGGVRVTMTSGAGVYADISDHCGNFEASVVIEKVEYGGLTLNNMTARMATDSSVSPAYLNAAGTAVESAGAPASGNNTNQPITDMFGYVIDLAFRTNAAESNLLLQREATDRIYSDNENEGTMGHGSNMTFSIVSGELTDAQVAELLKAIRLVFFTPGESSNAVIVCAKLDVATILEDKTVTNDDGSTTTVKAIKRDANGNIVANLILYKEIQTAGNTTYVPFTYDGTNAPADVTIYSDENGTAVEGELVNGTTYYVKQVTTGGVTEEVLTGENANVIMPLTQNTAHQLSVLVYMDGNLVGNDDVAAQAATSMVGQLNLQFASSATLVPMDYSQLHTPKTDAGNSDSGNTPAEPTP